MVNPLYGAWLKVKRADQHLSALHELTRAFLNEKPYDRFVEPDPNTAEWVVSVQALKQPPAVDWGVIVGDVVGNLRSALDHLVWELTIRESGPAPADPVPRGSRWRQIAFPIAQERGVEGRTTNTWVRKILGVRPGLAAQFEDLQPFSTTPTAPAQAPLAVLDELWNIDKHRAVTLVLATVDLVSVAGYVGEGNLRFTSYRPPGPIGEDKTELGRFVIAGDARTDPTKMDMRLTLDFDIAFEQGPPAYGAKVIDGLRRLQDATVGVLGQFEREFT